MSKIGTWSTTAASNNATPPDGWPEGQAPSTVNDCAREMMASIRTAWNTSEWFDYGDTPSRASATTFKVGSDVTGEYTVHRRLKCFDGSTLYGTITASSYSSPDTTITIALDSGSLTTSLSSIALAALRPTSISVPSTIGRKGEDITAAATTDIGAATGDFVDITSTAAITALGTIGAGIERTVRFKGAMTLTHNAASLILPSASNITTADGDVAMMRSLGSGNWQCVNYMKSDGTAVVSSTSLSAATQAEMESASSTAVYVSPARAQFHPSASKAWVSFDGTGTLSVQESYNVSSVTDLGTGDYRINFSPSFANTTYATCVGASWTGSSPYISVWRILNKTTSSCNVRMIDGLGASRDHDICSFAFFGSV